MDVGGDRIFVAMHLNPVSYFQLTTYNLDFYGGLGHLF